MNEQIELTCAQATQLKDQGFVRVDGVLTPQQVDRYVQLYDAFLSGNIATGHLRADLGGHVEDESDIAAPERITQIMWPSARVPVLHDAPLHLRSLAIARQFAGDDMAAGMVHIPWVDMIQLREEHSTPSPSYFISWANDPPTYLELPMLFCSILIKFASKPTYLPIIDLQNTSLHLLN